MVKNYIPKQGDIVYIPIKVIDQKGFYRLKKI